MGIILSIIVVAILLYWIFPFESLFFYLLHLYCKFKIEINPTPTIHNTINFANAINELNKSDSHYGAFNLYKKHVKDYTVTGYILTSAIFAIKAKHSQWQD